ncbi:MAG TPA: NAD(P)/FAD-dependent oxidoreductase [Pseudolabrys sp.]|nr:NAD(P)/FAD-dependent oxidoreductase [Pseudolabrys sp.]
MSARISRRTLIASAAVAAATTTLGRPALAQSSARVVIIGGGFGGAMAARAVKRADPRISVTLIEQNRTFTACPLSNAVVVGLREIRLQQFSYERLAAEGIALAYEAATSVDAGTRSVLLNSGTSVPYDRLILAPGIDFHWEKLAGYNAQAAEQLPHAWKAGEQTLILRRQLESLEDGANVLVTVPANPYRCAPAPYERASLIAWYLKNRKPRSKVIVLDAKDQFSMQRLFQNAWKELYPDHLEWVSLSDGGNVTAVEVTNRTVDADFNNYKGGVVNIIPPQKAGRIADIAGVADRTGWCPVDPVTFESKLQPNMHVLGDAALLSGMAKSAFAATASAKACAAAVVKLLANGVPSETKLINACYSLIAPDYAISIAGVYQPENGAFAEVEGSTASSPVDAPRELRAAEAKYAEGWFNTITAEVFG